MTPGRLALFAFKVISSRLIGWLGLRGDGVSTTATFLFHLRLLRATGLALG